MVGAAVYAVHIYTHTQIYGYIHTYLSRRHILFMYLKLGQRRLSGIAPFQDFMAHGRLQAAITVVDIVLPLSFFLSLFLCLFVTHIKSKMYTLRDNAFEDKIFHRTPLLNTLNGVIREK